MSNLSTTYLGLNLRNPIIVGSSGLTDTVEKIVKVEQAGAGAVVLKSLFEEEILMEMEEAIHAMTNRHFVFPEAMDYLEADSREDILENYLQFVREAKNAVKIPVIASINCVSATKWTAFARAIEEAGADALELNLFFLPSNLERGEQDNLEDTRSILAEIKNTINIPVALKISPFQSNLLSYTLEADRAGADGLVLFNRSWLPDIDLNHLVVSSGFVLSSPADLGNTLRWVSMVSGRIKGDVAASTGVHDGAGVIKQLLAGASACQVVSTLYLHELGQIKVMLGEVEKWMKAHEFRSINEFKGRLCQTNSGNPAAWERVQFMKHFRNFI